MSRVRFSQLWFVPTVLLSVAGCASTSAGPSQGSSRLVLTGDEIAGYRASNLYETVEALRPQWLRPRSDLSIVNADDRYALVYVNNIRLGRLETLRDIISADVTRVEWIGPGDATTRFGTGHAGGVILVSTRRGPG